MLLLQFILGVLLAIGLLLFVKHTKSTLTKKVYVLVSLILGIAIMYYGYKEVRGFEGSAYFLLAGPVVFSAIIILSRSLLKGNMNSG